jgi:multidrug efflux pump subunit AcrB
VSHGKSDQEIVRTTHNTARFFTENRHISWVALAGTVLWGIFGFLSMPQRKDPDIPVKVALAACPWPGVGAEKVERLVTRRLEEAVAENIHVERIESTTRVGVCFVYISLQEDVGDPGKEFDDIKMKLDAIGDLPEGAGPIQFVKDFGSTAALMLTVASPKVGEVQVSLRARAIRDAIERARAQADPAAGARLSLLYCFPSEVDLRAVRRPLDRFLEAAAADRVLRDGRRFEGPGFIGLDCGTDLDETAFRTYADGFVARHLRRSEFHPDIWPVCMVRDPQDTEARLAAVAGDKYSYRELEEATELVKRTLHSVPQVSKIDRAGILDERVYVTYSQERLASYGLQLGRLRDVMAARNIPISGGVVQIGGKNLTIDPSGEFRSEREIGEVIVGASQQGTPLYLRDVVDIERGYETPPRYLNFYTWRDADGTWRRSRGITLAVQMRPGEKIGEFGAAVDRALERVRQRLPEDLIYARTSDQPLQVEESIGLFMSSLLEAVVLVVLVALVGFWEWRSAFILALSIPLTLAMTFGMMSILGLDLQQISIASLIIALGLLVDDPVVAGDAIKRSLAAGHRPLVAAWLGPTKLATAILFATVTNIVAYLPFLILPGDTGRFLFTLPVVLTCSLVASRIVSMTFIPLLGYYLLKPPKKAETPLVDRRTRGFAGAYYRLGRWAIQHRWAVFAGSLAFLVLGGLIFSRLKTQFFPKDLAYLSYVDVWLPEDATLEATGEAALLTEDAIREVAEEYGREHAHAKAKDGHASEVLKSLTTFVGGGGPRFWFSVSPEPRQENYAQIIIQVNDKHDTQHLVDVLQAQVPSRVPGARVDVRQLESGANVGTPVAVRLSGDDLDALRAEARELADVFRAIPIAERVQDDWGTETFQVNLEIDPDRANLAGITNYDAAVSTSGALNGMRIAVLREGDEQIPVVARLRMEERAQLADLQNLYVHAAEGTQKVPLRQISRLSYSMELEKIKRRDQFHTITVACFPVHGLLPSQVLSAAMPAIRDFERQLPPGFAVEIGGEGEKQKEGFGDLAVVLAVSVAAIFLALVLQFRNAVKPLLVFGAIPYGVVGAVAALGIMGAPFGFMAFLGVVSLVGVIVSHVIVLFDFIEEERQKGEPLVEALLDAGIVRLRPVLITVGATVFALVPLASHGGPLWEPLCYVQIGGLTIATVVTLLLVPVLYSIFVLDLKIVRWEAQSAPRPEPRLEAGGGGD